MNTKVQEGEATQKRGSVTKGIISTIAALVLAAAALESYRVRERIRSLLWNALNPFLIFLRRLHSGLVEDYVLWFMIGSAVIAGTFVLSVL